MSKFEEGKKYVFSKEKMYKNLDIDKKDYEGTSIWFNIIDGMPVHIVNQQMGIIKCYQILPKWCKEVK